MATTLPQNKVEYCTRFQEQTTIKDLSNDEVNHLAFQNDGGLFNGGVCWWHSRFQRNVLYLGIFRPDLAKPTSPQAIKNLIHQIRVGDQVFNIPGYNNLEEFSKANQQFIQQELNDWQLYDGVVLGSWIDGLSGSTKVPPSELQSMMKDVFNYVSVKKKIAFEKLQLKGIASHAWLIAGIKAMPSGYELGYIDSNYPLQSRNYSYKVGDDSFFIKGYGNFVPYLDFTREEERLVTAGKVFCGLQARSLTSTHDNARDYQLDLQDAKRRK